MAPALSERSSARSSVALRDRPCSCEGSREEGSSWKFTWPENSDHAAQPGALAGAGAMAVERSESRGGSLDSHSVALAL